MIAAEFSFPAGGRFHATPWGRHVNEGPVEWPIEPWRLLRALVATWYHKARADIERGTLVHLITALADSPPAFHLPAASLGHARHWMPVISGKNSGKTKIFDAFVHVADGESIGVRWNTDLLLEDRIALGLLLERLGYLGRAESLVEARLLNEADAANGNYETRPLPEGDLSALEGELVRVLVPLSEGEYRIWREGYLQGQAAAPVREQRRASLPATIFDTLLADTGTLQAAGWSLPPGTRRVTYLRPADAFRARHASTTHKIAKKLPTVARYAVTSAVLPRLTGAVSVADRVHQSLLKWSGNHPVFSGRDETNGLPRRGHEHAHIFCEVSDRRDAITHLTVFAQDGFDSRALLALRQLNRVWGHGGHDLQLVLLGVGQPADFAGADVQASQSPILQSADEWVSLTPFIPTRHGKFKAGRIAKLDDAGHQIGGADHDLLRLLRLHRPDDQPEIVRCEKFSPTHPPLRWLQFQRRRTSGDGLWAGTGGHGYRVRFAQKVAGPIAVGYGAHFGLGLFQPATK